MRDRLIGTIKDISNKRRSRGEIERRCGMMVEYVDKQELLDSLEEKIKADNERRMAVIDRDFIDLVNDATVVSDMVEVDDISEQIIRKKAEVSDYWLNDVMQYRTMQGYPDIEHDIDNFLRGYNEAVEDILAILDGTPKEGGEG